MQEGHPLDYDGDISWFEDSQQFIQAVLSMSGMSSNPGGDAVPNPNPDIAPGQSEYPEREVRILPLRDSITYGWPPDQSPNGYRL